MAWRFLFAWFLLGWLAVASVQAELPLIRFDRLSPIGAAAGSTLEVEILGGDIEEVKSLLFDHPGLKAEFVKERFFKVSVAADVPAGTYDVRLVGRFGVSNPRLLAISHGLTDVAEVEPNNEPEKSQLVAVNSAINGSSDQNGEDWFRFEAKRGQRVTVDCLGTRLDSTVDGTLTLTNKAGKQLASNSDYFGADPFLDFVAPEDGEFFVKFHDLTFNGGAAVSAGDLGSAACRKCFSASDHGGAIGDVDGARTKSWQRGEEVGGADS